MERLKNDQHKTNAVKKTNYPTMKRGGNIDFFFFFFLKISGKNFGQQGQLSCYID
jgi:hypothetical protein